MRVLHIWDVAGVASVIAKYQKKLLKWDTWVVMRREWDPYGLTIYGDVWDTGVLRFYIRSFIKARGYNILHVHARDRIVKWLKRIYRGKCIVLHYHGSDIRGKWIARKDKWIHADIVLVSTEDLYSEAPREYVDNLIFYLPNPVDTELFKPLKDVEKARGKALYIYKPRYPREEIEWARQIAEQYGLDLEVIDLSKTIIKHSELPYLLNKYEYFIDRKWIKSLSKLALEALACGLKVIKWDGKIIDNLPEQHRPENVVKLLEKLYLEKCGEK